MKPRAQVHSMKRRCFCHDYYERGIYMITLEVEGRRPILGELVGERVELSELGRAVADCWRQIPRFHPEVSLIESAVMPDHFHGLLFVRERMARHLGEVVRGFKIGCTKAYRALVASGQSGASSPSGAGAIYGSNTAPAPQLFAEGYHDRILLRRGQLQVLINYIRTNAKRLAIIRSHPDFFTRLNSLEIEGRTYAAYGNPFLLNQPDRLQIQCSRRLTADEIAAQCETLLNKAERGAVLVSPCISPGEKEIARAALADGLPLIVLLENGFAPKFKPSGRYFDACSNGKLLMLAPWPHHFEKRTITRAQCLALNAMAQEICGPGAAACDYCGAATTLH